MKIKKGFVMQYVRKSELPSGYMAGYINTVLKCVQGLINLDEDIESFDVYLRGACWSTKHKGAFNVAEQVFHDICRSKFNINILNSYNTTCYCYTDDAVSELGFKTNHSHLRTNKNNYETYLCNNISSMLKNNYLNDNEEEYYKKFVDNYFSKHYDFTPLHFHPRDIKEVTGIACTEKEKKIFKDVYPKIKRDHSKEVLITCKGEIVFYMAGSSNFSETTYATHDGGTDQSDIAFFFDTQYSRNLLLAISEIYAENNDMLKSFSEIIITNGGQKNEESSTHSDLNAERYRKYKRDVSNTMQGYNNFPTTPYIGNTDLFDKIKESILSDVELDLVKERRLKTINNKQGGYYSNEQI